MGRLNHRQTLKMFLSNLPWLGKAFLLTTTIAVVKSQHDMPMPPMEECCTEKMVGSVSYTLLDGAFHGAIPHQCLNDCVYTVTGTSSPKFCFQRGDLPTECLSDAPVIELVGGSGPHEGNVMIRGQPVCDDHWGGEDALVVCRQLGYHYGFPTDNSFFGPVSTDFAMDDVQCTGNEDYIWRCPHETEHNCGSSEGAGVICSNEPPVETTTEGASDEGSGSGHTYAVIGLVGGSGPHEGNIMVYGKPVCDDIATPENAQVVCRQLGYLGGEITTSSHFGTVSADFAMDEVNCNGTEEYFWRCPHESVHNCGGLEAMGVICSNDEGSTASGSGHSPDVVVSVRVKDGTSGSGLADASAELMLEDGNMLSSVTDSEGYAVFSLSSGYMGETATIIVTGDGYVTVTKTITIGGEQINFFLSPELADGQHRLVLSWESSNDLDVYVLQKDKTTGDIVCKTWYMNQGGCTGVNLDIDVASYGPETITWTDADNDAYLYELYVHDYSERGVAGTGAAITLYGESSVELSVVDGDSGDLWWMLGTFEPSVGTSSFSTMDFLQSSDPDTSASSRTAKKGKRKGKGN